VLFVGDKGDTDSGFDTAIVVMVIPPGERDTRQHDHNALPDNISRRIIGKQIACCARSDGVFFDLISFLPRMKGNKSADKHQIHAVYYGTEKGKAKISEAIVRPAVPALSSRSLPVVPFAEHMAELLGTAFAVDERGDAAGAEAISLRLPLLVFVPPQEEGGLANFGKATHVLRTAAADFKSATGHDSQREIAYFSEFAKVIDRSVRSHLDNHAANPLLVLIAEFGTGKKGKKRFEQLGPCCHQAFLASDLPRVLREVRAVVQTAFSSEVATRCDNAIGRLMDRIFLQQRDATEADLARRLEVLHGEVKAWDPSWTPEMMEEALRLFPTEAVDVPEDGAVPGSWRDRVSALVEGEKLARSVFEGSDLAAHLSGDTGPFCSSADRTAEVAAFANLLCSRAHWVLPYVLVVEDLINNHDCALLSGEVPPKKRHVPAHAWPDLLVYSGNPGVGFVPNSRLFRTAEDDKAYARNSVTAQRTLALELSGAGAGFVAESDAGAGEDNSGEGAGNEQDGDDDKDDTNEDAAAGDDSATDGASMNEGRTDGEAGSNSDDDDSDDDDEDVREKDAARATGARTKPSSPEEAEAEAALGGAEAPARSRAPSPAPGSEYPALLAQLDGQQRRSLNADILQGIEGRTLPELTLYAQRWLAARIQQGHPLLPGTPMCNDVHKLLELPPPPASAPAQAPSPAPAPAPAPAPETWQGFSSDTESGDEELREKRKRPGKARMAPLAPCECREEGARIRRRLRLSCRVARCRSR
jgi:hypothetical protein